MMRWIKNGLWKNIFIKMIHTKAAAELWGIKFPLSTISKLVISQLNLTGVHWLNAKANPIDPIIPWVSMSGRLRQDSEETKRISGRRCR